MKTSGLFRVHATTIKVKTGQPFKLILFGDIHRDSPNHAKDAWQNFLRYGKSLKHAYFLGLGDYLDSTSTSERDCLGKLDSQWHETLANDLQALQLAKIELLAKEMGFMRDRLLGLMNGNHYFNFQDGTNSDQKLCTALGAVYLGVSCFLRLTMDEYGRTSTLDIWAHHGLGAGRLLGGSINRVDQMREHAEADIYVMGHDHKRMAVPATPRLYLSNHSKAGLRVRQRQQWLVRSGSFLASYRDWETNYNVDAGRGPCSLGHVELIITPFHNPELHENQEKKRWNYAFNDFKIQALC